MAEPTLSTFVPFNERAARSTRPVRAGWVVSENGCHIWQGQRSEFGYAKVYVSGAMRLAYRVRYEREIGPIPEGMQLDHFACDNGPGGCCNPAHVRPVTPRENQLRGNGVSSLAAAQTHCVRGHPLSGDNLRIARGGKRAGRRVCRTCDRARCRTQYLRRCARKRANV